MRFKALRAFDEGATRSARIVELDLDDLDPGDVVIRNRFAAVNYKDARAVSGEGKVLGRYPLVPGIEMAGEVIESRDARHRAGDLVTVQGGREFGMTHDGAFAEIVRVPGDWAQPISAGFDAFTAVGLGIAAYTSAVAIERLEALGVSPDQGEVIVTGASGGCGSFAVAMLAKLGFRVVAMTGKADAHDYLIAIGATRVIGRDVQAQHGKPLDEQLWAAAIDTAGGASLDFVLRTMRKGGVVAAFGNAAGETLATSIYPFILRNVTLAGVNANHPVASRTRAWSRMTDELRPRSLDTILQRVPFAALLPYCEQVMKGAVRGRGVVVF